MPKPTAARLGHGAEKLMENTEPVVQLLFHESYLERGMGRKPMLAAGFVFVARRKTFMKIQNYLPDGKDTTGIVITIILVILGLVGWAVYKNHTTTIKPAPPDQNSFACAQLAPTIINTAVSNDATGMNGVTVSQTDSKGFYNKALAKCFVLVSFTENPPASTHGVRYFKALYDGVAHTKLASNSDLYDTNTNTIVQHICSIASPDAVNPDCTTAQFDQFVAVKMSN